jgi:hypothetical protein
VSGLFYSPGRLLSRTHNLNLTIRPDPGAKVESRAPDSMGGGSFGFDETVSTPLTPSTRYRYTSSNSHCLAASGNLAFNFKSPPVD